jgi:membrane protein implicated in regulation of membrane protease activity
MMWIIIGVAVAVVVAGVVAFLICRRMRKVKKESLLTNQSGSQLIKDSEKVEEETES